MKKKKNIYFLVPAVIFIWGLIGYKVFKAVNPTEDMELKNNSFVEFVPNKIKEVEKFTVNANYRDPFLGRLFTKRTAKKTRKLVVKNVKPEVEFPNINYNGIVAPKKLDRPTLFLLTIQKQQHFLSVGKQIDGVTLIKGNRKEITISFQNTKKTIQIQ